MKTIQFTGKASDKFQEVRELMHKVSQEDHEAGIKMRDSFAHSLDVLIGILHNFPIPKDEYGYELDDHTYTLEIGPDSCPGSFYFGFKYTTPEKTQNDFHGGLILHGLGNETYSVNLGNNHGPTWSIHT